MVKIFNYIVSGYNSPSRKQKYTHKFQAVIYVRTLQDMKFYHLETP